MAWLMLKCAGSWAGDDVTWRDVPFYYNANGIKKRRLSNFPALGKNRKIFSSILLAQIILWLLGWILLLPLLFGFKICFCFLGSVCFVPHLKLGITVLVGFWRLKSVEMVLMKELYPLYFPLIVFSGLFICYPFIWLLRKCCLNLIYVVLQNFYLRL